MNILKLQFICIEEAKKAVKGTYYSYLDLCDCQGVKKLRHKLIHARSFKNFSDEEVRIAFRNFYKNEVIKLAI